jgi:ATP-dependent helicase HrpA
MKPELRAARAASCPTPEYDGTLPVHEASQAILEAIRANPVTIICGETGSGKTTQIPKLCLTLGRGIEGLIGCTQPRRIAARSVASRLAYELKTEVGAAVGYKVRFHDRVSPASSFIKVMTDGILLAEIHHDRLLKAYDTLIIDEAHERSLNIDFLLGYIKRILPRRPDLKVIITSATLEADRLSKHFNNAPVIEVSGRTYPVETRYRPIGEAEEGADDSAQRTALLNAVDELARESRDGDILVFLPGERDIRDAAEALRKHHPPHTEILPLFARLSFAEQDRVFKSGGGRRIVLSTNVAETSLTVPGIRYVVDTGTARINRYSLRNKVTQLQVEKTSQASAKQRAGRCGRVMSGICIRLYSEQDHAGRPAYTTPEILRTSLAAVILKMESLGLGRVENFPFLDAPSARAIEDGYQLLTELGGVAVAACSSLGSDPNPSSASLGSDPIRGLTPLGLELAKLPVDPRIGRMLLAAREQNCMNEMLIIASALTVQDPRDRPQEHRATADQKHVRFRHEHSEFLSIINLWTFFNETLQHKKSNRKLVEFCRGEFLSLTRLKEWHDIYSQLHALVAEMGLHLNSTPATYEQIHRALLSGLLGNIGLRDPEKDNYMGPRGVRFYINPGSSMLKVKPQWIIAAELAETTRLYARCIAKIEPEWIEPMAGHLLRRSYHDPHWDSEAAQVNVYEKVSLYGLTIVGRRRARYGPIDPVESRRLFIRHALVLGEYDTRAPFFKHNAQLVEEIEALEHKARRQDVLVDDETVARFYEGLLPSSVWSGERFEKWRRDAEQSNPLVLYLERDYLMRHAASHITEDLFPHTLELGGVAHPLAYRFEPGHALDGVSVAVPLVMLGNIEPDVLEWLVPGLIRDKITALLKKLPQRIRRELVPLPAFITAFLEKYSPANGSLTRALSTFIQTRTQIALLPEEWSEVPDHLRMNISVLDAEGREVESARDLSVLRQRLGAVAREALRDEPDSGLTRSGLTHWEFGHLPSTVILRRRGLQVPAFPALVDEGLSVAIQLADSEAEANRLTRLGLVRLCLLELNTQVKALGRNINGLPAMAIAYLPALSRAPTSADKGGPASKAGPAVKSGPSESVPELLKEEILMRAVLELVPEKAGAIRTEAQYLALRDGVRAGFGARVSETADLAATLFKEYSAALAALKSAKPHLKTGIEEARAHLSGLVYRGFIEDSSLERLQHFPRYLKAVSLRVQKMGEDVNGDTLKMRQLSALQLPWQARLTTHGWSPELEEFRWMMEELRVSLFAQTLKTPYPVSEKRLQKRWDEILRL